MGSPARFREVPALKIPSDGSMLPRKRFKTEQTRLCVRSAQLESRQSQIRLQHGRTDVKEREQVQGDRGMGQEWRASVMVTAKLGKTHAFRQDPEVVWTSPGESEQKQRRLCLCLLSAAAGTEGLTVGRIPFTTIREWLQNSQPIDKAEIKRTCCTVSCDDGRSTTVVESSAAVQVLAIRALTAMLTHSPRTHPLCATIDLFLFTPPSTSCTMGLSFTKKLQTWLSNWDILLRALLFLHPPPSSTSHSWRSPATTSPWKSFRV